MGSWKMKEKLFSLSVVCLSSLQIGNKSRLLIFVFSFTYNKPYLKCLNFSLWKTFISFSLLVKIIDIVNKIISLSSPSFPTSSPCVVEKPCRVYTHVSVQECTHVYVWARGQITLLLSTLGFETQSQNVYSYY